MARSRIGRFGALLAWSVLTRALALSGALALFMGSGVAAQPVSTPSVSVTARLGLLSLDSSAATLGQVLSQIARASGVQVFVENGLAQAISQETVTATFSDVTVEQALRRVLRGKNCLFVYASDSLVEARVYVEGTGQFRPLVEGVPSSRNSTKARVTERRVEAHVVVPKARRPAEATPSTEPEPAQLAALALTGATAAQRLRALEELSGVSDGQLIRRTTMTILGRRDEDPEVLGTALDVLGEQEHPPLEPVLELLRQAPDSGTRIRALDYLAEHGAGDPRTREAVARSARTDRREELTTNARELLDTLDAR